MKLVTFLPGQTAIAAGAPSARVGVLHGDHVIDIAATLAHAGATDRAWPPTLVDLLAAGPEGLAAARRAVAVAERSPAAGLSCGIAGVRLLAPIPRPGKIVGVGRNYGAHAAEGGLAAQEKPRIFLKPASSVIGPGAPITKPAAVTKLDYETELAVVIGRPARDVDKAAALDHVAGYTILNDVSARELQFDVSPPQTSFAKSMDGFCPIGPCLATPDEFTDVTDIQLRGWVNGELVQDGTTRDMIFPVPHLIAYLSRFLTLETGDVIATGTPAGVGAFRKPPRYLARGDVIRMEVPEIGILENAVT